MLLGGCGGGGGESTTGASTNKSVVGSNAEKLATVEAYLLEKSHKWYHYYRDVTATVEFQDPDYFSKYGAHVAAMTYPGSSTIIINSEFLHSQPNTIVASTLVHEAAHIRGIRSHAKVYMLQSGMLAEIGASSFWVNYYRDMAVRSM